MVARSIVLCVLLAALAAPILADLRLASQPYKGYKTTSNKNAHVKFNTTDPKVGEISYYIEPSTFGWAGLLAQRGEENKKGNNYDQFLRSNVDNQHDKRNFNTEDGKDHLPFRTYQGATTQEQSDKAGHGNKVKDYNGEKYLKATPGQEFVMPLRWNNPHASEIEVNIWIAKNQLVVPIRRPACAGEGHQDAAFSFKIPTDWNTELPKRARVTDGYTGCAHYGDCTVQIYAHSVETRIYAIGIPIVIEDWKDAGAGPSDIENVFPDPGMDLDKLQSDICMSSSNSSVHLTEAKPRKARWVSDQFNHAYQNSNQSPYHGQQQDRISRNLQAAAVAYMLTGNRGELGRHILRWFQHTRLREAAKRRAYYVKKYEYIASSMQALLELDDQYKEEATMADGAQSTAKCFRCPEVGATNAYRQDTTTYIPSWEIPGKTDGDKKKLENKIRGLIPAKYRNIIKRGKLLIYEAVLDKLREEGHFDQLAEVGLYYQQAMVKDSFDTMKDDMGFKRYKDPKTNKYDGGRKAARMAYAHLQNKTATTEELEAMIETQFVYDDSEPEAYVDETDNGDEDKEPEVMHH